MIVQPLVNGKAYEYTSITLNLLGVPITEISSINYEQKQARKMNYGTSQYPTSYGNGPIESTVQLKISMNEMENVISAIPPDLTGSRLLQNIPPFDIIVVYLDPALITKTHILKNCLFLNDLRNTSQGDTAIFDDYNLICSNIIFQ